ncbi:MAG: Iron only nitrogenase protein AnfO (AnfO_nitrog) [Pelotomaculum sp. PtaB.Bin013]|uniref:Nitrogenase n=1 Tax=Pelotomaculum isophthalicicum JI TaxID=947010 RepID=A0A9X4JTK4_9FIRM|nr:Fe-only nitrogenase accessory AnfO family protein [Pelotomaculum isophthalicicum]MDF9408904.1 nitrogenase [Pelotomaculum isophthalicicum JI]OPX86837.1 MAG: Iron only nitrogenase protein AnfO (AnfO_nitrog) [Pelotomaculum sp. PtaB.Bin013]
MPEDIAVYIGEDGRTASLFERGMIAVCRKEQGHWTILKEKEFSISRTSGLPELRKKMTNVQDFLGECKIFVGLSITGVPYFELEKGGFSVWEYEGNPLDFLDHIIMEEENSLMKRVAGECGVDRVAPVAVADGCYRISLKEIQEGNTGITTKQALLPFIRKGEFYELEVLCSHVPPWLEAELAAGSLCGEKSKTGDNEFKITITRKYCCQP